MPHRNTLSHAREVLANTDPDIALLQALESFDARDPKLNELRNWIDQRAKDLSTADLNDLLAFGYLGWVRHQAPVPTEPNFNVLKERLSKLEPDFFPVLLKEIKSNEAASPSFRAALSSAREHLSEIESSFSSGIGTQASKRIVVHESNSGGSAAGTVLSGLVLFLLYVAMEKWGKKS